MHDERNNYERQLNNVLARTNYFFPYIVNGIDVMYLTLNVPPSLGNSKSCATVGWKSSRMLLLLSLFLRNVFFRCTSIEDFRKRYFMLDVFFSSPTPSKCNIVGDQRSIFQLYLNILKAK